MRRSPMNQERKRKPIARSSPPGLTTPSGISSNQRRSQTAGAVLPQKSAKNRQAEACPNGEIQPRHPFQRRMQLRVMAWLQRDHKRQRSLLKSRLLQQRIDVEMVIGQNLRQPRHNPRLIPNKESK